MATAIVARITSEFREPDYEYHDIAAGGTPVGQAPPAPAYWRGRFVRVRRSRARLGYAYVMNKLDFYLENDPREKALRDAVYRAMSRLA